MRLIGKEHYRAHCRPIFKRLGILPLPCMYVLALVTCVKCNYFTFVKNSNVHNHGTRGKDNFHTPHARTKGVSLGPEHMGIKLYNRLPSGLKEIQTICVFRRKVRDFLLKNLFYSVNEYLGVE